MWCVCAQFFGSDGNSLINWSVEKTLRTTIGQISAEDVHGPQRINPIDFADPLYSLSYAIKNLFPLFVSGCLLKLRLAMRYMRM